MEKLSNDKKNRMYSLSKTIGIVALFIVMFSSVATAGYFATVSIPSNIKENTPFDITITMQPTRAGIVQIFADNLNPMIGGAGIGETVTNVFTCSGLPAGTHDIWIHFYDAQNNYGLDDYRTQITVQSTSIPEFPSIVLPVAAILGLVVIFGRRKI